jgi:hypothetical protein
MIDIINKPDFVIFILMLFYSALLYILLGHCIRDYLVYPTLVCIWKNHIKCWQGGREEAVLYGLWWETGSGRGSYINSQINVVLHSTDHKHRKCYLWITTKLKQNDMKYTCYNNINQVYDRHYKFNYLSNMNIKA